MAGASRQLDAFDRTWIRLADQAHCDSYGATEYRRVRQEWEAAGRPQAMAAFIRKRANIGPFDNETETTK